jgi:hypothetical protein
MLSFLARFLAVVLAALFVCTAVAVVFLRPVATQLLEPRTYKDVVRDQRIGERLPELAADTIGRALTSAGKKPERATTAGAGDFGGWLQAFSTQDTQTLISAMVPADYVNGQFDSVIDQLFGYVNSAAPRPSVKISLVDLKQRLSGGVLEDAYVKLLQGKPPCVGDQGTAAALPVGCCPPEERLPEVRAQFRAMVEPAAKELADSVDLFAAKDGAQAERVYRGMDAFRARLRTSALVARWSWVLAVVLLAGVGVFGVRSVRGLLLWWGLPCLIAGVVAAVFALPGAAMGGWFFRIVIAPLLPPEAPVLAVEAVLGLVMAVAQVVLGAALKSAAWLVLGGLVAVILSPLFKTKAGPPALG